MIGWKDYPKPNLRFIRNVWVVEVSIPTSIRHLFGNGSGATNNKRKSTGTTDEAIAEKRVTELAHKIYKEFDEAQLEYANRKNKQTDKYAESIINSLAKALKYNKGLVPLLEPSTDYDELVKMKARFDNAFEQVEDEKVDAPSDYASIEAKLDKLLAEKPADDFSTKLQRIHYPDVTTTPAIVSLLNKHSEPIVQSYWQDLLTEASIEQGKTPPVFNQILDKDDYIMVGEDADGIPRIMKKPPEIGLMGFKNQAHHKPISRPRRNIAKSASNILSFQDEYYAFLDRMYDKIDTRNKLKKGLRRFIDEMGDMPIQEVEEVVVYAFMDKQIEDYEDISKKVLKDNNWGCSTFYEFLKRNSYYKGYNPFKGINYKRLGREADKHLAYKADELHAIFRHNWKPQERLFLQILVTTGMRLSEVGNMTWERYHENYDGMQGLRVFSLADTDAEKVTVKNSGSKRDMPLHDDLVMPPKGTGRIFDYKQNKDGLCSHDAGRIINPILQQIVSGRHKSLHSFRRTFKVMLRSVGVSEEINNNYTGHKHGGSDQESYGGVYEDFVRQEINKMKHPWLKYKSKLD
ncbi:hypothetical protein N8390_09520 [Amylibacter sp.]|nr:hypothetical protein [Amylibacter sp.]